MKVLLCLVLLAGTGCSVEAQPAPACEWCGADEAAGDLRHSVRIAAPSEPGEPMVLSGRILKPDRRTPAGGVLMYLHHTNAKGLYPTRGNETGNGRRHGYLRGWLRTGADGAYEITTIRPAQYPSHTDPAHVHATIQEPGKPEYWIDSFIFEGDPLLTPTHRLRLQNVGGSGIVRLARDAGGVWRGTRDIVLAK